MATENNLQKIHVFPSQESYEQNISSVGADDLVLIPDNSGSQIIITATGGLSVSKSENTYTIDGSSKADSDHNHSASDITSGVLSTSRGGTGNASGTVAKLTTSRTFKTNLSSTTAASFNGSANVVMGVTGTLAISHGGTGVTSMTGSDYTTNRPRGIILQSTVPSTISNGCIVGVYEL